MDRIDKLRSSFAQHVDNVSLVQAMTRARRAWRNVAKERVPKEVEGVKKRRDEAKDTELKKKYRRDLEHLKMVKDWSVSADPLRPNSSLQEDKAYGFAAYEIKLKRNAGSGSYGDYSLKGHALQNVLYDRDTSPLVQTCDKNIIRYFHFPANNMLWVEEAIARYYGEERGEYNYRKAPNYREKMSNILCREFWTAQQHGSISDPIHARHMRSQCSFISTDLDATRDQPEDDCPSPTGGKGSKNFVIFMPYLHWETDNRRRKMAEIMRKVTNKHQRELRKEFPHLNEELREKFAESVKKAQIKYGSRAPSEPIVKKSSSEPKKLSPWGEYLMSVYYVYDAMDIEPDMRALRENLHKSPPLHPRRTLDQSYHSKLENTGRRDEDQVVYRGTKAGRSIYRTTKTVMVDQLWLYILDERTIFSFFPRRWGRNKPDFSGVHKSIRSKLEHLRAGEIQSVYDLALLIMNQCSMVFFDRTKPADDRPQVLDLFANAIANVSEMKTVAFESFWRHLDKMHLNNPRLTDIEAIESSARIYLDVNPEGMLLREAHDIMDELRMIGRIYLQQLKVAKHFSKALQDINEQASPPTSVELVKDVRTTIEDINDLRTKTWPDGGARILNGNVKNAKEPKKPIPDHTIYRARYLLEDIENRQNELRDLEDNTSEITDHLKYLLDLKQQQASIIEAKSALARADESVTQGRAIMMFTIITIIFLPLSFMSSLFGMNAKELSGSDGGIMSLRYQFTFMFPISVAVITVSLALAFSPWIRNFISFTTSVFWAAVVEYTYIRRAWRFCIRKQDAKGLSHNKQRTTAWIYGRKDRKENKKAWEKAKEMVKAGSPMDRMKSNHTGRGSSAGIV